MKMGLNSIKKVKALININFKITLMSLIYKVIKCNYANMMLIKKKKRDQYQRSTMKPNHIKLRNLHRAIKEVGENICKISQTKKLNDLADHINFIHFYILTNNNSNLNCSKYFSLIILQ